MESVTDVQVFLNRHMMGEINGKKYCMDEILIKKAEQHFTQYEVDIRNACMGKAMQIVDSGNGNINKAYIENYLNYDNSQRTLYFINGKLICISPAMKDDINYYKSDFYNSDETTYDISTVDGINILPVPKYSKHRESLPSPTIYIEYILQRKAMDYSDKINNPLALASFKKANQMMPYSNIGYLEKDYMNYIKYLEKSGLFEEAVKENRKLQEKLPHVFSQKIFSEQLFKKTKELCKDFGTDLVEASYHLTCSSIEAKYRGRIYSLTGKDKRFPLLPKDFHYCNLSLFIFIYGVSSPVYCKKGEEIEYSNRPFIDDRTPEEIANYNAFLEKQQKEKQLEIDRSEYYKIVHKIPDLAPKSLRAYRKIKNEKTTDYQLIAEKAVEIEIHIP